MKIPHQKGFTLLEILMVVLVLGILVAMALPQYRKAKLRAQNAAALAAVHKTAQQLYSYFLASSEDRAGFLNKKTGELEEWLDKDVGSDNASAVYICNEERTLCKIVAEARSLDENMSLSFFCEVDSQGISDVYLQTTVWDKECLAHPNCWMEDGQKVCAMCGPKLSTRDYVQASCAAVGGREVDNKCVVNGGSFKTPPRAGFFMV